jgi:hypothetical protein
MTCAVCGLPSVPLERWELDIIASRGDRRDPLLLCKRHKSGDFEVSRFLDGTVVALDRRTGELETNRR